MTRQKANTSEQSELLKLLNQRAAWEGTPFSRPTWSAVEKANIISIANLWGRAHPADPFAEMRMRLYMLQGLELPSDILKQANIINAARYLRTNGIRSHARVA